MAFVSKDTDRGKVRYRICWNDATRGAGKKGRRFVSCSHGKHREAFDAAGLTVRERLAFASGATNKSLRENLCKFYKKLEIVKLEESVRAGGFGFGPRYDTKVHELFSRFIDHTKKEVEVREKRGGRAGKSPSTLGAFEYAKDHFEDFLKAKGITQLTTGELSGELLKEFKGYMVCLDSKRKLPGKKKAIPLSPSTINSVIRTLKSIFLHYLDDDDRRPYFRLTERTLKNALSYLAESRGLPERFAPIEIARFIGTALKIDNEVQQVKRSKAGKIERFEQKRNRSPVFPWAIFLALTGCRVHEAEGLKWDDVDLDHGSITFRSRKTGRDRRLHLADIKDTVSPALLELLKAWRKERPEAVYVLPETSQEGAPVFPKHPWANLQKKAKLKIKAKALRSNWTSYCVSMGIPASIVALWAGHSPAVLERHYLAYAHARLPGSTLEEALGISEMIEKEINSKSEPESSAPRVAG